MRLGAHISTAGGVYKAFARAAEVGCDTMLVFTKSNRQWKAKPLTEKDISDYQEAADEYKNVHPVAVHASYLINIASPDGDLWEKSYQALKVEVQRAGAFNIPFITFHPGSYTDGDEEAGLAAIAKGLRRLLKETAESAPKTTVCLETMAGQGTNLGSTFEQLAQLLEHGGPDPRLGVCFDTCHVFAAGYDIRTPDAYEKTLAEFDRVVGLEQIRPSISMTVNLAWEKARIATPILGKGRSVWPVLLTSSMILVGTITPHTWKHPRKRKTTMAMKWRWIRLIWPHCGA